MVPTRIIPRLAEVDETRVPNIGWRSMNPPPDGFLFDLATGTMAYFVHSHAPEMKDPAHVAAVIRWNNVIGYQFHPEKSGPDGLSILYRFMEK